jgi:three-Cys-motif partner protein
MKDTFFDERSDQSEVKARIVQKYFYAWAQVIMPTARKQGRRIGYVDLYAGPGRYKDGSASTPLMILEHAIRHPDMAEMLVSFFNDSDGQKTATLQKEINNLPNIEKLKHKPIIHCDSVDDKAAEFFSSIRLVPTFSFIDPFGYKGLSLQIIKNVIKDWGCDCVFFFNYNRINAGITNKVVATHIEALFGEERTALLKHELPGLRPDLREARILEALATEIKSLGGKYVLPFTFKNTTGVRTSHKLVFVTKHFRGYEIMKDIMAAESSTDDQGVPSLTYSPADASMPLLFSLQQPLTFLKESLLIDFSGRRMNLESIYEVHSVDKQYVRKNYRTVLLELENEGKVTVLSPGKQRRKGTFPSHVEIRFP